MRRFESCHTCSWNPMISQGLKNIQKGGFLAGKYWTINSTLPRSLGSKNSGKAMSPNTPKKGFLSFDQKNWGMLEHKFETRFSSFPPFRVFGGKKWVNNWINLYKPLNSTKPCGWHLEVVWSLGCLSWRWPCTKGFAEGVPCYENLLPRGFGSTKSWVFRVVLEDWTKLRF